MGCGIWTQQVNEIEKALGVLSRAGISPELSGFQILRDTRSYLYKNLGVKLPRTISQLIRFIGFSPGVIALWHDSENGFMSEARTTPGSPPVYKSVSGDIAIKILRHDISPELEQFLMAPATDIDN